MSESLARRGLAELFGTFWLVFGGCGSAIFAAKQITGDPHVGAFNIGIGYLGVALAFGLTVLTMVYAVGHISGGHFNPAVTIGAVVAGRLPAKDLIPYWIAQVVGGLLAGLALWGIAKGRPDFYATGNMAANGFGAHSPDGYGLVAVLIAEILLTAFFLIVILGSTDKRAPAGFAGVAIGLSLTLIHLISIPISNTSVNPARSTGVAFFNGDGAPGQLWLFWLAPLVGGIIGAVVYVLLFTDEKLKVEA
ncbi:MAG TPA: aquaporin Z [Gordonia sp. (in: high G+C Gram-positive bacteria)]|uniref:aquaporin Z n=1 Tax=unclassified Gordonia (in: high G+C Gram-positive bacteria) TaxID=2657482 RepID=UPI000FAC1240|nr:MULTISPECIES: aquaporin Z [unclassified Gordonia (in: high G+C Gram-positive bacteria)]RUP40681.1 MAG: aquaporin Z [Gordonia sp. (in: high G+C Gram-positive bacteria)]HNP57527.1 aquaporin Z [Gordonia sp. (in: high G+C Gram-positive bacteria)]HRC51088.1 aquaporin Z [Gordonia sp. (in: high G+C Gram-positive bacteria)]